MRRATLGSLASLTLISVWLISTTATDTVTVGSLEFERVELQLNEFTSSTQAHVSLAMNDRGQTVAVWDSRRQQSGTYGVYARTIEADGSIQSSEMQVNLNERSMQQMPAAVWVDEDQPFFAWTSYGQDGSGSGIVARAAGNENFVPETLVGGQSQPALASLDNGHVVAVWCGVGSESNSAIYGRIVGRNGAPEGQEFAISAVSGALDRLPTVAANGNGFVVAWDRARANGDIEGIYARRFDVNGSPLGDTFRVSTSSVDEIEPTVAMDRAGNFVVGWMRLDARNDYDPFYRRYDSKGAPLSDPTPLCSNRNGWQSGVALAMNSAGELAATWTKYQADDTADVMGRLFAEGGAPLTEDFVVTEHRVGRQTMHAGTGANRIALADDGSLAVSWQGDSGHGDRSAANLTLLRRAPSSLLASAVRDIRNQWTMRSRKTGEDDFFQASASPVTPPTYDPSTIHRVPDPFPLRRGDNGDIGFVGINSTGWNPPDPHMAIGPSSVVLCTNGAVAAKTKEGVLLWQEALEGSGGFWGAEGAGGFVFDPEAQYDPQVDRYYVMANERTGGRSYFLLGISSSEDVTEPWHKYRFDVTNPAGNDIDSPNLAFDDEAIYLTADFFGPDKYLIYIVDKASVIDGGTAITNSFLRTGTQSIGLPAQHTNDAPRMYMIEHFDGGNRTELRIWSINDPFGLPSITSTIIDVDPYWTPGSSRSRGTSQQIYLFEARFWNCMYINGSIWACHHIRTSSSSTAKARWYEIEMNGWPDSFVLPNLVQQGTVDGGENLYLTFNSISADPAGNAYMAFATSGTNDYYSISRTYRLASDPLGSMSDREVIKQSTTTYAGDRWGDYSAVNFDPVDPGKFWSHHEYTPGGNQWSTWVEGETIGLDPSAVPLSSRPEVEALRAYPNPMTRSTTLRFSIPRPGDASLSIFDASGRAVRSLALPGLPAGQQEIAWDGQTDAGEPAPNGVFLARVVFDGTRVAEGRLVRTK